MVVCAKNISEKEVKKNILEIGFDNTLFRPMQLPCNTAKY